MHNDTLGIGLTGKSLTDLERRIITETSPYAIILFGRNVGDAEQLRALVREVKAIAKRPPVFMIDEEGGRVDRLRHLLPGLPSAEAFGEGERPAELSQWFGKVIGMALRYFDIEVDLAPVVDIRGENSPKGLERRTFGRDPETVITLAGAFMDGLQGAGTAACLKHFPGIGIGSADPHYGATVIDVSLDELRNRDLVPFAALGNKAGAVMIGHGSYPQIEDPELPATLSRRITGELLRDVAGFDGLAITDDMEMHAVSDYGSYESITERALLAGNDVVMFCSHIERVPDIQNFLAAKMKSDDAFRRRVEDASRRAGKYRQHIDYLRADGTPAPANFDALIDEAARFVEAFQAAQPEREIVIPESERRKNSRTPGTGRTGREEWT
ncbi:MAG TPA: beta-N-acetylhexosaminidase [Thermoanaerobaculia bacterium]